MEVKKIVKQVGLEPIRIGSLIVPIKGKTPLLMDKMPDRVKKEILIKQTGISKSNKKKVRDTKEESIEAIHMTSKGQIGFPLEGFKKGMMECTSFVGDKFFSKKLVMGSVKIINTEEGLVPIKFKKQDILVHTIATNTKFTPQFHDWSCELNIQFDQNNISEQDIMTLVNYAGFYVGIGAWRPKGGGGGSGSFGMYEVKMNGKKL